MTTLAEATQPRDTSQMALLTAPAKPPLPPAVSSDADPQFNALSIAPIPPALGQQPDSQRQFYRSNVSQLRMLPIQGAANPSGGAQSASQAQIAVAPAAAAAASAQTGVTTINQTAVNYINPSTGNIEQAPISSIPATATQSASLTNLPDGTGAYANTSGGTSYRPTTNPLTSVDAGANATINIASFDMNVSNRSISSPVAYNSGTITALSYGTLYYVYVNDPDFAGGAVTYVATTTKTNVLSGSGYLFVGSIFTAVSGGGTTTGNNDGGSGAQYGNNVIVYPTANTSTNWSGPSASYSGNPASGSTSGTASADVIFSGFSSMVLPGCSGITIMVDLESSGAAGKSTTILYSLNSGSSFSILDSFTGAAARTVYSLAVGTNINPAIIQIKVELDSGWTTGTVDLYQVWLLETF